MRHLIAHFAAHSLDELRVLALLATAAFVSGGVASSALLMAAWLLQHRPTRGAL